MSDTAETIQTRLLEGIDDSYDKSEGSFFSDIVKTNALEFEQQYVVVSEVLDKAFIDTSYGDYLDRKVIEQGIIRNPATHASGHVTITGQEGSTIAIGNKVASDTLTYAVLESKTIDATKNMTVAIECDDLGSIGNCPIGAIKYFPVTLAGLVEVTNGELLTNGYNAETDEELRQRYLEKVQTPPTSGNKYNYLSWAKEVIGVGDAKIFPLWNGNGTVKVVIVDSNKVAADTALINAVITNIEENRPIGATVTVISATEKLINIALTLVIDNANYKIDQIKESIQINIAEYLATIAFQEIYVSYAKIGSLIIATTGVLDYSNLTVNGGTANITVGAEEVAITGTITNI
ncbi:baseplate J/gp47 family protein [Clostridium estertheticum]|uniref:baseplate J/gp47 family protein n=1 Tax=Clostridium estertheticum TaxID=238834 RepID=UPI001CF38EC3|nr:baseplate J/gp47 family protein [Clostridium estertheticum]MCB2309051.1 baseplate J/gp47 family protein [Clostridium estertheticum]MCB2346815.1 baseplate J/gp47 family protein [Clostridium estertheticum]MCB2351873.1 baseplate J/gp47 family protein [Clostridium estertheticum]WAG48401.1 baseplate J/gp47 family protein [Clostridium estertheticum]